MNAVSRVSYYQAQTGSQTLTPAQTKRVRHKYNRARSAAARVEVRSTSRLAAGAHRAARADAWARFLAPNRDRRPVL